MWLNFCASKVEYVCPLRSVALLSRCASRTRCDQVDLPESIQDQQVQKQLACLDLSEKLLTSSVLFAVQASQEFDFPLMAV